MTTTSSLNATLVIRGKKVVTVFIVLPVPSLTLNVYTSRKSAK